MTRIRESLAPVVTLRPRPLGVSPRATAAPCLGTDAYAGASDPRAAKLVAGVLAGWKSLEGMTATSEVVTYEDGRATRDQVIDATYRAPNQSVLRVVSGDGAGARLTWDGSDRVHVKKGLLSLNLALDNPLIAGAHGWTLHDTGPGMIMRVLADPATRLRLVGRQDGLDVVEVRSPASPAGVTREELAIDPARHLVVERRLYAGDTLLGRTTVRSFQPGLPADDQG